jgi:hypothetical protein
MPLTVNCSCGQQLRVQETLAGKKVRCPKCQGVVMVPQPVAEPLPLPDPIEEPLLEVLPADPPAVAVSKRPRQEHDIPSSELSSRPRPLPRSEDELEAPRIAKRELRRSPEQAGSRFGSVNAGVGGGLLMILIAVVWFFGGLAAGFIFYYPPILLVVGIFSLVKGMMNHD